MISSHMEVSIRLNICGCFTPLNHLKQQSQREWFVSSSPIENVENFELSFPSHFQNTKADGTGLRITKLQACTTAEGGTQT